MTWNARWRWRGKIHESRELKERLESNKGLFGSEDIERIEWTFLPFETRRFINICGRYSETSSFFFFFFFFFVVRFWEGVGVLFGVLNATSVSFLFLQRKDIYGLWPVTRIHHTHSNLRFLSSHVSSSACFHLQSAFERMCVANLRLENSHIYLVLER